MFSAQSPGLVRVNSQLSQDPSRLMVPDVSGSPIKSEFGETRLRDPEAFVANEIDKGIDALSLLPRPLSNGENDDSGYQGDGKLSECAAGRVVSSGKAKGEEDVRR